MMGSSKATTPAEYITTVPEDRRKDIKELHAMIHKVAPNLKPHMLAGMLGYGKYHYRYASGREGDWSLIALANQKNYISLYVCAVKNGKYLPESYKSKLPKASIGKSCIRFKRLEDLDRKVLEQLLKETVRIGPMAAAT